MPQLRTLLRFSRWLGGQGLRNHQVGEINDGARSSRFVLRSRFFCWLLLQRGTKLLFLGGRIRFVISFGTRYIRSSKRLVPDRIFQSSLLLPSKLFILSVSMRR